MTMFKHIVTGALAAAALASGASAATLIAGTNHLDEKVFSTGTQNSNTITGETKPSGIGVSFYSTSALKITGQGYAQIEDGSNKDDPFNNLKIFLTTDPNGFTALEFSVQFSSKVTPSQLTISYDLLGGGSGSFAPINFANDGLQDWQILAGTGEVFKTVYLTSNDPMDKVKQVDITPAAAPAVPEPATWLTMIAGFGLVGVALRRRGDVKTIAA